MVELAGVKSSRWCGLATHGGAGLCVGRLRRGGDAYLVRRMREGGERELRGNGREREGSGI